jgi:hypothetical protein
MYLSHVSPGIVQALDELIRADLQNCRDSYFWWLIFSALVVAIGVILEGPEVIYETVGMCRRRFIKQESERERHTPDWITLLALLGWILVALGVAGEGIAEGYVSWADGTLQTFNDILLTETRKDTGFALERASQNEREAAQLRKEAARLNAAAEHEGMLRVELEGKVAWRRLSKANQAILTRSMSPFKGVYAAVPYSDLEGFSFASDIALSLRAAHLQVFSPGWSMFGRVPSLNGPIEKLPSGIDIATTTDSIGIAAGKALHDKLDSFGFDVNSPRISPPLNMPAQAPERASQIWVSVMSRPEGPQGEAKLRENAKQRKKHK